MSLKSTLFRSALLSLHKSGLHGLAPASLSGVGVVFMLHRVRPALENGGFAPNAILEITPEYLNAVLTSVRALDYDFVSLDEMQRRLKERRFERKFAAFTLDDGYRDNLDYAAPIFAQHRAPFTVYVSSGMPDGTAELWWLALEEIIRGTDRFSAQIGEFSADMPTETAEQKQAAFDTVYWPLRNLDEHALHATIRTLCGRYGFNLPKITADCALSWQGVRDLGAHAYGSIGAHTVDHYALSKLTEQEARDEIVRGAARIKEETGDWPRHLAYPFGDSGSAGQREFELARFLGFDTATTTRKGFVTEAHATDPFAIPRLSLNGDYQDLRMLEVLMSGVPFALARVIPSLEVA